MALTRRQVLWLAAVGATGLPAAATAAQRTPAPAPRGGLSTDPIGILGLTSDSETMTLEAWSDTLIPGRKRHPTDPAIAGAARGPGAVQAGAVEFMRFGPTGVAEVLPAFVTVLTGAAAAYATTHRLSVDPTLPPFVALRYADRKSLVAQLT